MAQTSLAKQLRKLATPQTNILFHRKTRPSLLFDPSKAAEIDRATFYEIGIAGLNELIEVDEVFEEFRTSLFDETSKSFERAVETLDVNHKLNKIIKKFLYLASPHFLLKSTQNAHEWLIVRFHIHEYNTNELICSTLPYHGTRLFARLLQVFDLKKSNPQWQWLYQLQREGIPLSKTALFNHCSSDANFLKMICDSTVDAVKICESNASKLATLFGFYSTTVIGTIQTLNEVTELHLTHMLPSIFFGLSSDCVDYCASALMIISSILIKSTFQERLRCKLTEKIAKVNHIPLRKSVVLLLNIMYQSEKLEEVSLSRKAIKSLTESSEWFIPAMRTFSSSGMHTNVFYLLIIRDSLGLMNSCDEDKPTFLRFAQKLINSCKIDDVCAKKMIRIVIDEARKKCDKECCKLVKSLENQYPNAWDSVVASLFEEEPDESLSHVLGFTSATTQIEIVQKLYHPVASIRAEAIKNIANNPDSFKLSYIENSLRARWNDEDPSVVEAMFLLPENLKFYSTQTFEKLLLKSWLESKDKWNSLLLKILQSFKVDSDFSRDSTKYLILLLPFLMGSSKKVQNAILNIELPLFVAVRNNIQNNPDATVINAIKDGQNLPSLDDLIEVYQLLCPTADVHIFTFVLLLSYKYEHCNNEDKDKMLHFFFDDIFPAHFKKMKQKLDIKWDDEHLYNYYQRTSHELPIIIAYKFFETIIQQTAIEKKFSCSDWCDFTDENLNLIALLFKYLNRCSDHENDNSYKVLLLPLVEKFSKSLSGQLGFLCNMCIIHQQEPEVHLQTLKMMEQLLSTTKENYQSWVLNTKSYSIVVPSLLISLYSTESSIRNQVIRIVDRLTQSIGPVLTKEVTYAQFLKYLRQFSEEIVLDRSQLLSRLYAFLAQDEDIQSLLPVAVRCFTKIFHDLFLEYIIDVRTPLLVSASLLQTFDYLRDSTVIRKLVLLAHRIVSSTNYPNDAGSQVVRCFIDKFNVASLDVLEDEQVFAFIEHCVNNFTSVKIRTENGVVGVGTLILEKFSVDLFDSLDAGMQKFFLDFVLRVCSSKNASHIVPAANSFMKKINLNCELLESYFTNMRMLTLSKTKKPSSVRRRTNEEPSVLRRPEWKMGIALLELIQNKKKLCNCHLIIPSLFAVLEKCCEVDDYLPMEYAKQVCLSCLLNCSKKMTSSQETKQLEALFNVELIVKCIRMSPNPQTHHHALSLLAHGASFAPNQVLHNIMAIFTFMGSSVLRQDDAFSLQIISNILETIVPLLVNRVDSQELSESAIVNVMRVFAATIPDIPDHRRVPLLKKLMKILHHGEYTYLLVILSMASCAKSTVPSKSMAAKYSDVLQELLLKFPPQISLTTFEKVVAYVNQMPHNLGDKNFELEEEIRDLFDLKKHSNKELCHFKYLLMNFTATAVSGHKFIEQISALNIDELLSFESHFKGIIEQTILYIRGILDFTASSKVGSAKYWKVMISQALEILNKTNALLTCETFIIVVKDLIEHDCLLVQRKSLELLNWRLQAAREGTLKDEFSPKSLTSLIPSVMKIISTIEDNPDDHETSHDVKLNQQTALISVKLLIKHCSASGHILPFKQVLSQLINLQSKNINEHVLASLILCVAELMATLKVQAIDGLPKFIPALVSLLEPYQNDEIAPNDVVLICIITALQKVVETLPNFLSPYLKSILCEISRIRTLLSKNVADKKSEDKPAVIVHKLNIIEQKIATEVPSRVLWPSISGSFVRSCETHNLNAIKPLLSILVASFPKNCQISSELTSIFLTMFDFRCTAKSASDEDISLVEEHCIEALCSIVLKCSESTFRPFYHKLFDWGVIASKDHLKGDRILTYYKILFSLSESLKSIFVLFASNFVRNAMELLDKNNVSKHEQNDENSFIDDPEKCVLLVDSILKTFHNVFKYDTVKFLTKDRFNLLLEPLANQIENTIGDYKSRSENIIVPCIAKFGAATSDDSLWKQFNYFILLKTRHSSPEVRITALETVCTFATHLGDNFQPFLPESVPFFVELLEDENEIVEKQSQRAVQRLEQTLNESVRRYF